MIDSRRGFYLMRGDFLKSFATGFAMLGIVLLALSGGTVLGKYYTRVLQNWQVNPDRQAVTGTTAVTADKEVRTLKLNPVAFYFVQNGVFSDLAGAEAGAAELVKTGLQPYTCREAPFRVFVGVFGDRDSAVKFQGQLREQGIGGFIQTIVLNSREITLSTGSKKTADDLRGLLEDYTAWFQDNAGLWRQGGITDGDQKAFSVRMEKVISTFHRLPGHLGGQIADQGFREKLEILYNSTGKYISQLEKLKKSS
ncbi:SPOR domain-containing protein, partial [bacterium]